MFEIAPQEVKNSYGASIKVLGVGGAGGNVVNSMIESGAQGIEFIVANTDAQALAQSKSLTKIQLGVKLTKGLGSGAHPEVGRRAVEEDIEHIVQEIGDADIVFLTAGMGGGTGSGALPVIAHSLKERGILSIAIVTRPFVFEGTHRARVAQEAIDLLSAEIDTLVVVSNQKLLETVDRSVSMINAFDIVNKVLYQSVKSIADIIINPGHINVDFADIKSIMKDMGMAVMGTGRGSGQDRAAEAALQAIASPLLENMSIEGAGAVLLNITGGVDLGLHEIHEAAALIQEQVASDANIIIGSVIDQNLTDEMIVTVIATGFNKQEAQTVEVASVQSEPAYVEPQPFVQAQERVNEQVVVPIQDASSAGMQDSEVKVSAEVQEKETSVQPPTQSTVAESGARCELQDFSKTDLLSKEMAKIEAPKVHQVTDDLDVPTFMRKEAAAQQERE